MRIPRCVHFRQRYLQCRRNRHLAQHGVRIIAIRSAGYNQIDLATAKRHNILVARVPAYSPNAISEFTVALMLTLGRKTHKAYNRSREFNFEIAGLEGFELRDKTIGVFGTGKIGQMVIKNLSGFGCRILAYDKFPNEAVKQYATYVDEPTFAREADIIPETRHILNEKTLPYLKDGVFIVILTSGASLFLASRINDLRIEGCWCQRTRP